MENLACSEKTEAVVRICFIKKSVFKYFAKFIHLCQSLILNKVAGLRPGSTKLLQNFAF